MLLAGIAVQALLGWVGARAWMAAHNTLAANGNWISTKTRLERGVGGAFSYVRETQSLVGGRLHLAAWHGYQEVLWRDEVAGLRSLAFDLRNHPEAATSVILDRGDRGPFRALTLSANPARPSRFHTVAEDGEFLDSAPLSRAAFAGGVAHRVELAMDDGRLVVCVDGETVGELDFAPQSVQRFGFRGSSHASSVDNVVARLADGETLRDSFDAPAGARRIQLAAVGGIVLTNLLLFGLLARLSGAGPRLLGFYFLMVNLTLVVIGLFVFYFVVQRSGWYPGLDRVLEEREAYHRKGEIQRVLAEVDRRGEELRGDDRYRVLFVGSSQTWGAGAMRREETFIAALQRRLDTDPPGGRRVACINAGISATLARDLLPLLRDRWLPSLGPDMVVVNLTTNDQGLPDEEFGGTIRAMIRASREAGAQPVLIQEPSSYLGHGQRQKHRLLGRIGAELGVPVIALQEFLWNANPTGFLWWDRAHPTSYGQRLMAEELYRQLAPLLEPPPS